MSGRPPEDEAGRPPDPATLELLRQGFDAYNRSDWEALVAIYDPEVECRIGPDGAEPGTWHGHQGLLEMLAGWDEAWEEMRTEPVSFDAPDESHIVTEVHLTARGAGSGVPVEMTIFHLFEIRDGLAVRFHLYGTREQAIAAIRAGRAARG